MTMHGAKGLEYEIVFLPDVKKVLLLTTKRFWCRCGRRTTTFLCRNDAAAKTKLIMSYVKTRLHHETDPSRFLDEIFPEICQKSDITVAGEQWNLSTVRNDSIMQTVWEMIIN